MQREPLFKLLRHRKPDAYFSITCLTAGAYHFADKVFFLPMFKRDDFFAAKGELKKISIDTPLLNRLGMNTEDYYYDADFLYQKRKEDMLNKIALGQIIQVRSTGTKIGNRCVWQVRYLMGASRTEKTVSILNNYSLFNQDFAGFLSAVRVANPEAEVEKMTI
ncbi:hypothetical protein [Pantoea ananatis]|uniref:hypothetical protein n=1 Tax=Pantoea ananas TaxID=553 RepID=UPI0021E97236|nr:hypothetical protein [Pantoea ananatis]MCV3297533.1 hypothetical protein [Pantoea ananatis]